MVFCLVLVDAVFQYGSKSRTNQYKNMTEKQVILQMMPEERSCCYQNTQIFYSHSFSEDES